MALLKNVKFVLSVLNKAALRGATLAVLMVLLAAAASASTVEVRVMTHSHLPVRQNDSLYTAVLYYDVSTEQWTTRGWWLYDKAREANTIRLDNVDVSKGVYYIGFSRDAYFVDRETIYGDSIKGWVDSRAFRFHGLAGEKPEGENVRAVRFYKSRFSERSDGTNDFLIHFGDRAGDWHVYDHANIFSGAERQRLRERAREYSEKLGVHFVILTFEDASVHSLDRYTERFYDNNIAGLHGIYDAAFMTINMHRERRLVSNWYLGELRTMVSDAEANVIREGYTKDMTDGKYEAAARHFLDRSAKLIEEKFAFYNIEVPEVDPSDFVYDFSGLLSEGELRALAAKTRDVSLKMDVGHVIVILESADEREYLRRFARSFYRRNFMDTNLFGGGWFILAVSAKDGTASAFPFGLYQPTNDVIRNMERHVRSDIREHSLYGGCLNFPVRQAGDEPRDYEMYHSDFNMDVPEVDPSDFVYDFSGLLSEEERRSLAARARDVSLKMDVGHIIVILESAENQEYLREFAGSFYKRNFEDSGLFDGGWFMLAVSAKDGAVFIPAFGGYRPENSVIREMEHYVRSEIREYSLYDGCLNFPVRQAERLPYVFEMPHLDFDRKIHDFAGVLTEEQEERLRNTILEEQRKLGVDFQIILSDSSSHAYLTDLRWGVRRIYPDSDFVLLVIGAPPELKSREQTVKTMHFGRKAERKMSYDRRLVIENNLREILKDDDYYSVSRVFIESMSKRLGSWIPNVKMVDYLVWVLIGSALTAGVLSKIILWCIRSEHNAAISKPVLARDYFVNDSLELNYISDVFVSSHTTSVVIQSSSSSSSDSDFRGSSGGGRSSGSQGRF